MMIIIDEVKWRRRKTGNGVTQLLNLVASGFSERDISFDMRLYFFSFIIVPCFWNPSPCFYYISPFVHALFVRSPPFPFPLSSFIRITLSCISISF